MKKIHCPLCHSKFVISYTEPNPITNVYPSHIQGEVNIGNYTTGFEGGGWDLHHADFCWAIRKAFHKQDLLQSYLFDRPEIMRNDLYSYEEYNKVLASIGLELRMEVTRNSDKKIWEHTCFIYNNLRKANPKHNKAIAAGPENAFLLFKHRLLCGELIQLYYPKVFQRTQSPSLSFALVDLDS